jgi:hypothetical protein
MRKSELVGVACEGRGGPVLRGEIISKQVSEHGSKREENVSKILSREVKVV